MSQSAQENRFGPDIVVAEPDLVHPSACLYGKVSVGAGSSLWPHAVVRAECNAVRIGRVTNIQDFVMIHIGFGLDVEVGDYCSITHHVTLHGCTIGDHCLIGIGATIMDGCVIGEGSIVAGHSFLREGTIIPPHSVVMGVPGKVVRTVDSRLANIFNAVMYRDNARAYARGEHRLWQTADTQAARAEAAAILGG